MKRKIPEARVKAVVKKATAIAYPGSFPIETKHVISINAAHISRRTPKTMAGSFLFLSIL
ncbi:hypothetical protein F190043G2_36340 [Blautia caecimuris]